jgi:hypothetical protein
MIKSKILSSISDQVLNLTEEIKHDISQLQSNSETSDKIKNQKTITESLYKITNIIKHVKKLEQIFDEDGDNDSCNDQKIIDEFIKSVKSKEVKSERFIETDKEYNKK